MIKLLHAADLHLDSPLTGREHLSPALRAVPAKLAALCRREQCDLVLLAGDLFDGPYTKESLNALRQALYEMEVPVFIAPGNHDYAEVHSPYESEIWPDNVHIFHHPFITAVEIPELDCRIYGAGFRSMDCQGLLKDFRAEGNARYHIGILHGDPTQVTSPYNPITAAQVRDSALEYLALGHIHQAGSFRAGSTLCAWPGCPMGRGFDELGEKGALIVTLDETVEARFVPLDTPRFHDLTLMPGDDPLGALDALLPPMGTEDHYRITLTGECPGVDIPALLGHFSRFPRLELRDRTTVPADLWATAGTDTLEGELFRRLRDALDGAAPDQQDRIRLAAKLVRQLLDGREVPLP